MVTLKFKEFHPSVYLGRKPEILGKQYYWLTCLYISPVREFFECGFFSFH